MARTNDKEHQRRIYEVAQLLAEHPGDDLTQRIMRDLGVSEAVALTYIKRARNLPNAGMPDITARPAWSQQPFR